MPPPPPSFSSFPELPSKKPPPPSFNSFPTPLAPSRKGLRSPSPEVHEERPSKRPRATDFLEELDAEIHAAGGSHGASGSTSGRRERSEDRSSKGKDWEKKGEIKHHKNDKERERDKEKHRSHTSKETRHERKQHERESDYGAKREKPWQLVKTLGDKKEDRPPEQPPPEPAASEPRLFYSDKRGDELNIRYGGLHKGSISRYRRLGAGRIVGLNSGLRITKESAYTGQALEVAAHTAYRTPRYIDPRSARHMIDKYTKRVTIAAPRRILALGETPDPSRVQSDPFLPSSFSATRFVPFEIELSDSEKISQLEHEEGQDYRSITGLVKPSDLEALDQAMDENSGEVYGEFSGMGISGGESQDEYLKRRNLEMDRALREDPSDISQWLAFVEFQDEVSLSSFGGGGQQRRAMSKAERASTSDIKLSILDRALTVPQNKASEKLLLAYLKAASEVWDPEKVLEKWDLTLKSHPTLTGLWIEYVSWRQTTWANFEVRKVVDVYVECFSVLGKAMGKELVGSQGRELLEANAIYLFLRCCLMLRQAGYTERALAAFQSIVELNFFRPDKLSQPAKNETEFNWLAGVFDELELFWDSGGPRIGENGAKGWKNTEDDVDPFVAAPPETLVPSLPAHSDPFERWADMERLTTNAAPLPARADDPGVDDDVDPFRVVLFDDIRDFLFVVHSPDARLQLVYAFLIFLGLPFVPADFPTTTPFSTDPFIHSELCERPSLRARFWPKVEESVIPFDTISGEPMEPQRRSALNDPFEAPFHTTPVLVDFLFGTRQKWFRTVSKPDLDHIDVGLVRNVFTLLRPVIKDTFFTLSHFALEAALNPKAALKMAKQVLRDNRQNLALWDGYARIERQRGRIDEARAVYVTTLSTYRTFDTRDQIDGPLLWRAWAEMEWEEGDSVLALKVLVAGTTSSETDLAIVAQQREVRPSGTQVLKARQYYTHELEASFQPSASQSILRNRNHVAFSAALFEYLTQGLPPAVNILEQHLFRLDCDGVTGSAEHEECFMIYVKILYRHASAGVGYKPGQLRDVLEKAIKTFPNNSLFLEVFYYNELRMKIQNRVRRTLEDSVLKEQLVTSEGWLFAIFSELYLDARSPSVWGVRNLFDRAVDNPRTRCSPSIWILFIDFEIRNNEISRAKHLVYRALRECPWCKELYLKPFSSPLRSQYHSSELQQMYSLLVSEKGLRSRCELSDFVEASEGLMADVERATGIDNEEDDGGNLGLMKETEELYAERRRLMPY